MKYAHHDDTVSSRRHGSTAIARSIMRIAHPQPRHTGERVQTAVDPTWSGPKVAPVRVVHGRHGALASRRASAEGGGR